MVGIYDIHCGGQVVGTAQVSREGLYYRFECRCQFKKKDVCKICITCGDEEMILGTPVPENGDFVLRTRLPIKRFCGGNLEFTIVGDESFIPVSPDEPFLYLKDLTDAIFAVRNGQCGVIIKKKPDA